MEKIIVGFSKPKKFKLFAFAIMSAYKIPYDHVYVTYRSNSLDRDIIYQASKLMVNFVGTEVFYSENTMVAEFEISVPADKRIALMQFMIDNAGKPYGFMNALGLGIARIFKYFGKTIHNPLGDGSKSWVCDEIVGQIIKMCGYQLPQLLDDLTPLDLYNYLLSQIKP